MEEASLITSIRNSSFCSNMKMVSFSKKFWSANIANASWGTVFLETSKAHTSLQEVKPFWLEELHAALRLKRLPKRSPRLRPLPYVFRTVKGKDGLAFLQGKFTYLQKPFPFINNCERFKAGFDQTMNGVVQTDIQTVLNTFMCSNYSQMQFCVDVRYHAPFSLSSETQLKSEKPTMHYVQQQRQ